MTSRLESLETKFWRYVEKTEGCWLWTGYRNSDGYGAIDTKYNHEYGVTRVRAHRAAWLLLRGEIPNGMQLDHLCRVRHCVNPDHLEIVTPRENVLRGFGPTAQQARQTHCKRGHELTTENLYKTRRGYRVCRMCSIEAQRRAAILRRATEAVQ